MKVIDLEAVEITEHNLENHSVPEVKLHSRRWYETMFDKKPQHKKNCIVCGAPIIFPEN